MREGPTTRWFVTRALDGWGPKLALLDASIAVITAVITAVVWRIGSGPRGDYEQIVPMLGTGLRWSVALPIAWQALGALEDDRKAGLLELARRRGVPLQRWILGRAVGAGTIVAVAVGGPMVLVSIVLAGLGGGMEGMLARLSLVAPSIVLGLASALLFGGAAVLIGALVPSRMRALLYLFAAAVLGSLVDLAVPGVVGMAAHQLVSPFLALEDLQALAFDVPKSVARGTAAAFAVVLIPILALLAAPARLETRIAEAHDR